MSRAAGEVGRKCRYPRFGGPGKCAPNATREAAVSDKTGPQTKNASSLADEVLHVFAGTGNSV